MSYGDWRPGDQRCYISDIRKAKNEIGWSPKVSVQSGVAKLWKWVMDNDALSETLLSTGQLVKKEGAGA